MSRGSGIKQQLASASILYGDYRAGAIAAVARQADKEQIEERLLELKSREVSDVESALCFLTDFYTVALERVQGADIGLAGRLPELRAIGLFEQYQLEPAAMVTNIVKEIDYLEMASARGWDVDKKWLKKLCDKFGLPYDSEFAVSVSTYLREVWRREGFGI